MKNFTSDFMILKLLSNQIGSDFNIPFLQEKEAESFIQGERTDCSIEYFLSIHGVQPQSKTLLQKLFDSSPEYLLSSTIGDISSHELISKIIKNNSTTDTIPVIHLLSCFSGAAHNHLKKVSGDVILCTYSDPNKIYTAGFDNTFIKLRISNDNLTNYIIDNFYLCAAVSFAISLKIGDKIFSYKTDSSIVTTTKDLQHMSSCLETKKQQFKQFTHSIPKYLEKNHLENPTRVIPLSPANFKHDKVSVTVNLALIVAVANHDSMDNIKNLLNKTKIVPGTAFNIALEENLEALKLFLNFDPNQVTEYEIDRAIRENFDALSLLLDCNASGISEGNLRTAIEKNKPDELQLLLHYAKKQAKAIDLSSLCQLTTDHEMLNILKNHTAQLSLQLTQVVAGTGECPDSLSAQDNPNQPFSQQIVPVPVPRHLPTMGIAALTNLIS